MSSPPFRLFRLKAMELDRKFKSRSALLESACARASSTSDGQLVGADGALGPAGLDGDGVAFGNRRRGGCHRNRLALRVVTRELKLTCRKRYLISASPTEAPARAGFEGGAKAIYPRQ